MSDCYVTAAINGPSGDVLVFCRCGDILILGKSPVTVWERHRGGRYSD